jgi:type I restriction enzyme M protein
MDAEPGMDIYDPCCGSAGLLIKCELVLQEKMSLRSRKTFAPAKLYGQESEPGTWAMANMNMIIHDMEGEIQIGDAFRKPKFRQGNRLQTFDRAVANPMWNQTEFKEKDYDADELDRFPKGAGFPGKQSADWGWAQIVLASLNEKGRAAVVLDTGAASRGSGGKNRDKERDVRRWFVEQDLIEGVIYLPENLFYNTTAPGIILFLNKAKTKERKGKVFLLNAATEFAKGDPKNYLPEDAITRIADTFKAWREVDKYSRIVPYEEIAQKDFNISPSRYIHTGEADEYRPIAEIVEELEALEEEAKKNDALLKSILRKLTVG